MPFPLPRIIEILDCLPSAQGLMEQLIAARLAHTKRDLIAALATLPAADVDQFQKTYDSLDVEHQARVLFSTELGETLVAIEGHGRQHADEKLLKRIIDISAREHAIYEFQNGRISSYLRTTDAKEVYSPLGDRVLSRESKVWKMRPQYLIDDTIAVDFDSPIASRYEPDSGTLSAHQLEHTEDEKQLVLEKLTTTLTNIDKASPILGLLMRNFVRRIIVRKSIDSSQVFKNLDRAPLGSEHRPHQPSSFRALNIHHPQKTIVSCMESAFHESVHNVLAYWETVNGYFAPADREVRPVSPWTGNTIPNHSLAHAVFVWYALHRLFERCVLEAAELEECDVGEIRRRLATFASGFLIQRPLTQCFTHSSEVDGELRHAIRSMQENIRRFYGHILKVA